MIYLHMHDYDKAFSHPRLYQTHLHIVLSLHVPEESLYVLQGFSAVTALGAQNAKPYYIIGIEIHHKSRKVISAHQV